MPSTVVSARSSCCSFTSYLCNGVAFRRGGERGDLPAVRRWRGRGREDTEEAGPNRLVISIKKGLRKQEGGLPLYSPRCREGLCSRKLIRLRASANRRRGTFV